MTLAARRADQLERLLAGEPVTGDPGLLRLAALAERIPLVPVQMDPDRRAAIRGRLLAVASLPAATPAERRGVALPAGFGWRARRRLVAAAAGAACLIAAAGVGISASRSLPGDPFYSVKLAAEAVQLDLAGSQYGKGRLELEFARTRLAEIRGLTSSSAALGSPGRIGASGVGSGLAGRVISTLRRMDSQTLAGSRDLTGYYQRTHRIDALRLLTGFVATQRRDLLALAPRLPAAAAAQATLALTLLSQVAARGNALQDSPVCAGTCQPASDQFGVLPCPCGTTPSGGSAPGNPGTGGSGAPGGSGSSPAGTPARGTSPGASPGGGQSSPSLPGVPTSLLSPSPLPTVSLPVPVPSVPVPSLSVSPLPSLLP